MANIASAKKYIQAEGGRFRGAVSEGLVQAMGGSLNYILDALSPVGTVVDSMLTEAQFQAEAGTGWVLANGRNVSGSRYAQVTGSVTIPDLRGVFRRGKNNGRSDGLQNPSGDIALGTYEADQNKSHTHPFTGYVPYISGGVAANATAGETLPFGTGGTVGADGGTDARPRAVTVNTFIRIN